MCGIVGFTSNYLPSIDNINLMRDKLHHRGPNSKSSYIDSNIALGVTRLSIVDIENGEQPYYNENKDIVVVFNGEIYNDTYLRECLQEFGHSFLSVCDGEVIPHLYEQYGVGFIHKLDGMFAIALWDKKKQRLILSCDTMGIKPLYYTYFRNQILFSSEIKSLRIFVSPLSLDFRSIISYLKFKAIPHPHTPYEKVYKLCPGEMIIWESGKLIKQYNYMQSVMTESDQTNLQSLLIQQIQDTMRSEVELGCIVSGGLDSSFVLRIMSDNVSSLSAFSVGYNGNLQDDETIFARRIAEEVGAKFHHVTVNTHEIPNLLKEVVEHLEEPIQDPICVPFLSLMREIKDHRLSVLLSGDGADEVFGGYARYRLWDKDISLSEPSKVYKNELTLFKDYELNELIRKDYHKELIVDRQAEIEILNIKTLRNAMSWEKKYRLPSYHLMRVDKLSMACGIEVRVPYLRSNIVAAASNLDNLELRNRGIEKYALRKAVEKYLPNWLMNRTKKPFTFPIDIWLNNELKDFIHDEIMCKNSKIVELMHPKSILNLVENNGKEINERSNKVWSLLVLESFLKQIEL